MDEWHIDINCDVGEGMENEARLFPYISSCNIACGGHAGDAISMREVVRLALGHGLHIGAHPSYPDRRNFGRVSMKLSREALCASLGEQLDSLNAVLDREQAALHHVKPHGALYNDLARDPTLASWFLEALNANNIRCLLYAPYGSVIARVALKAGFGIRYEAFGDRSYVKAHTLAPRSMKGALIEEPAAVLQHMLLMVRDGKVKTLDGSLHPIQASTYCIHGDTPGALQILMYLARELPRYGIYLEK